MQGTQTTEQFTCDYVGRKVGEDTSWVSEIGIWTIKISFTKLGHMGKRQQFPWFGAGDNHNCNWEKKQ